MKLLISVLMLAALAAPAAALSTGQRNADGGVTIRSNVSNGAVLDPGDRVAFQYQTARDGAVIVVDIDTQGYVTILTDQPVEAAARETLRLPDGDAELAAGGEPGVEFVFALSVSDRNAIDEEAFAAMRDETRRINGDPFIAANMIAAELVRDISQHTVFIGYTYFYVSERVEYPCYLCGTCDGVGGSTDCDGYRIVQNFDRNVALAYPLSRGYDMVETASTRTGTVSDVADNVAIPDEPTEVNFYPYGSEVHYADPVAVNLWYTWGWYDPFFYYYPYCYPYYGSRWNVSIGFGWGWGWGGYYCGGWYDPWYGCGYYPGYPHHPDYPYYPDPRQVTKFKSQYKSASGASTLTQNRPYASKRDGDLRVASKSVKPVGTKSTWSGTRARSGTSRDVFTGSSHRVKTSVSGGRAVTREAWAKGRSGTPNNVRVYRGQRSQVFQPKSSAGKTVIDRSGATRSRSGSYAPQRGTTTRSKSTWRAPSTGSAPRPSGSRSTAPRMGTYKGSSSSPSFRSGGGWSGGGRGGAAPRTGGGAKGGGAKGGRGR